MSKVSHNIPIKSPPLEISGEEFDRRFNAGEDMSEYLDLGTITHLNRESLRVNVDFPLWMVTELDKEAKRLGIPRQGLIKTTMDAHLAAIAQRLRTAKAAPS